MSDVFISYTRHDRDVAGELARQLELAQLSVFDLPITGPMWMKAAARALRESHVAIVLWSAEAVDRLQEVSLTAEASEKPLFVVYKAGQIDRDETFLVQRHCFAYDENATEPFSLLVEAVERAFHESTTIVKFAEPPSTMPLWLDYSVDAEWDMSSWLSRLDHPQDAERTPPQSTTDEDVRFLLYVTSPNYAGGHNELDLGAFDFWIQQDASKAETLPQEIPRDANAWLRKWKPASNKIAWRQADLASFLLTTTVSQPWRVAVRSAIERMDAEFFREIPWNRDKLRQELEVQMQVMVSVQDLGICFRFDLRDNPSTELRRILDITKDLPHLEGTAKKATE